MSQETRNQTPPPGNFTQVTETGPSEAVMQTLDILNKQLDILAEIFRPPPYVIEVPEDKQ